MTRPIRIFLSSPGDVAEERAITLQVIDALRYDPAFKDRVQFDVIAWDHPESRTPMLATMTPQEAINSGLATPAECDIVIVIFWSRLGTPLPFPEYQKPDGTPYQSGTEWEYLNALDAARETHRPLIAIYRRMERVSLCPDDADFDSCMEQYRRLKKFFETFSDESGAIRQGYNPHATPDEYRTFIERDLHTLIERVLDDMAAHAEAAAAPTPPLWEGSPFPGLRAFTPEDAPIFFGRGRETDALIRKVADTRFVAVVGASGSGKSSLVGAGLIPRLRDNAIASELRASKDWQIARLTPGSDPLGALASALKTTPDALKTDTHALENATAALLPDAPAWAEVLLFIDQFEELFTLANESARRAFIDVIARGAPRLRFVVTLRADFYHRCVAYPALARLLESGSFPLSAPTQIALYEMITRPAQRAALAFDDGLPEHILEDTGTDPGALALMAYALDELYHRSAESGELTFGAYHALGGVQGAIGRRAETAFSDLDADAQNALAMVFRELIEIADDGTPTRRRADRRVFADNPAAERLIHALIEARLLVSGSAGSVPTVDVAHEALFRAWERLKDWITSVGGDLALLRQMRTAAQLWHDKGRGRDFLWMGERGRDLQLMLKRLKPTLSPVERDFARPEADHLLDEIAHDYTSHARRAAIGERLHVIGDPRPGVGVIDGIPNIAWCTVPAGNVNLLREDGGTLAQFNVSKFWIAKYPVTYQQFQAFIEAGAYSQDEWWAGLSWKRRDPVDAAFKFNNHPRDSVNWFEAVAFCRWLTAKLREAGGLPEGAAHIRLPTEWEWQRAAAGDEARLYPWGGDWDSSRCNTGESGLGRTTAVGLYPAGASACGALDMSGNVQEWCYNSFDDPAIIAEDENLTRVLRGGAWSSSPFGASTAARDWDMPYGRHEIAGFRVAAVLNAP